MHAGLGRCAGGREVRGELAVRQRDAVRHLLPAPRVWPGRVLPDNAHRPQDPRDGAAVQQVLVAHHPQLLRRLRHPLRHRRAPRLDAQPGGLRHRPAQERREGADAGHVRLQERPLALPLLRRQMLRLHRIPTCVQGAEGDPGLPGIQPFRSDHRVRGGLLRPGLPLQGARRRRPHQVRVPAGQDARQRRRLARAQGHGRPGPPPPRLHLQEGQGGLRRRRPRLELRRRNKIRERRAGEGVVREQGGVAGHGLQGAVARAVELLHDQPEPELGLRQQLLPAHRQAQDLLRGVRQTMAQLHRRRLLHEEQRRRGSPRDRRGERASPVWLRYHSLLQGKRAFRDMHIAFFLTFIVIAIHNSLLVAAAVLPDSSSSSSTSSGSVAVFNIVSVIITISSSSLIVILVMVAVIGSSSDTTTVVIWKERL